MSGEPTVWDFPSLCIQILKIAPPLQAALTFLSSEQLLSPHVDERITHDQPISHALGSCAAACNKFAIIDSFHLMSMEGLTCTRPNSRTIMRFCRQASSNRDKAPRHEVVGK
jgi:hypothetical protein